MTSADWHALKQKGNDHFKLQENLKAAAAYTEAIKAFSGDDKDLAVLYRGPPVSHVRKGSHDRRGHACSNRSAALLRLMKVSKALVDADRCIELRPDWEKAHFRRGAVLEATSNLPAALASYQAAAALAPDSTEMTAVAKRVEKAVRVNERPLDAGDAAAKSEAKASTGSTKNGKKKWAKK